MSNNPDEVDLSSLNGTDGFVIPGLNAYDSGGYSVAGDINGDGFADIIVSSTKNRD